MKKNLTLYTYKDFQIYFNHITKKCYIQSFSINNNTFQEYFKSRIIYCKNLKEAKYLIYNYLKYYNLPNNYKLSTSWKKENIIVYHISVPKKNYWKATISPNYLHKIYSKKEITSSKFKLIKIPGNYRLTFNNKYLEGQGSTRLEAIKNLNLILDNLNKEDYNLILTLNN